MVRNPCEKLSTIEARTQPEVTQPVTIMDSTPSLAMKLATGVPKKIEGPVLRTTTS